MSVSTEVAMCRACLSMLLMVDVSMGGTWRSSAVRSRLGVELLDPGKETMAAKLMKC